MKNSKFRAGDSVVGIWSFSAYGYVKRVAKDGSWADVSWSVGLGCSVETSRESTEHLRHLTGIIHYWMIEAGEFTQYVSNDLKNMDDEKYYLPPKKR